MHRIAVCLIAFCSLVFAAPHRGVEILWDRFGVAHVYAKDVEGVFFGYGYAQMQSHANLILKLYGESRGRAAEYWGEKNLDNDRWVLVNDVPERGLDWYHRQTPEFRRYLDAFAAGMNEYAARHPEAIDPQRRVVLPITGADPLIHVHRIVHFTYISSWSRILSLVKENTAAAAGDIGSNAWAIAPSHTAAGHTMMLMNPHLPWMDWFTYYETNLVAPGLNLYGASQIGFPVLRFVFSDYLGFTQTVNSIDGSDLYRLTLRDGGYVFDGKVRQFETASKTIKIRQADGSFKEEELKIRRSVHGPVVWDKNGLTLALRTAALDRPFLMEQYWKMETAHTLAEYQAQLRRLEVPTFNITYADRDGHVMYMFNGTLPRRKSGDLAYWAGIIPGDTSETLWTSVHSYDELPKVVDPPTGFVQNTNDPPWTSTYPLVLDPANYPPYTSGRNPSFRTMRSIRMLTENPKMSFDDLVRLKLSTRLELADRILDDLIAAADKSDSTEAKAAAAVLRTWDRQAENNSRGALLFQLFANKFLAKGSAGFAVRQDYREPLTTPRGLADPAAAVGMLEQAAMQARALYGSLDAPWGDFMRLKRGATDLPANGATGALGAFRVLQYAPASQAKQAAVMGDTFVALVEFTSPPHAQVLLSYGNSSQPGSPHAEDQLPFLSKKQMRTAWRERKDVEANLESKDEF